MTHRFRSALLLLCLAAPLGGCDSWNYYRRLPAGQDNALWRPESVSDADFDAQTAHPSDLIAGQGSTLSDGRTAADAVDRMRRGHPTPLPASSISHVGADGGGGGGATGGTP
ncbi:MAG: hypothetical protein P4L66_02175 [Acetobacteraceae bacterium]|nr:hypothetical protein [Acetobacteraceae bacterium]